MTLWAINNAGRNGSSKSKINIIIIIPIIIIITNSRGDADNNDNGDVVTGGTIKQTHFEMWHTLAFIRK